MFKLHPQLKHDTLPLVQFSLCQVRLMNDMHYPWLILVPMRMDIQELYQLNAMDQQQFLLESGVISKVLRIGMQADKVNIAALGNKVEQLHVHHIARYHNDIAWPEPVFGKFSAQPYDQDYLILMQQKLKTLIQQEGQQLRMRWQLR